MKREYKQRLFNNTFKQVLWYYFRAGVKRMLRSIPKIIVFAVFVTTFFILWSKKEGFFKPTDVFAGLRSVAISVVSVMIIAAFVLSIAVLMILFGTPSHAKRFHDNFQRAGMINSAMESPALLSRKYDAQNRRIQQLEFLSKGLPLSLWQDNKEKIESAQNITIDRIELGRNNQRIVVYAVDGSYQLPEKIIWDKSCMSDKGFTLVLGESIASKVEVDLATVPHILLGGSTGSGKTILLKLLLMQCVLKHAKLYIADFKGGVDFNKSWKQRAAIITEPDKLTDYLDALVEELHKRKRLFAEKDCANIDEYNRNFNENLPRCIFACDEVAELLDKTGLGKKDKEQIQHYEAAIATLVRLGRAFGIHCILATQRPDANIISGQIKNNIDFRVCGRADDVLSQIVLDKTDANDLISKTAQGRFLTNTDVLFQAYYFDDKKEW